MYQKKKARISAIQQANLCILMIKKIKLQANLILYSQDKEARGKPVQFSPVQHTSGSCPPKTPNFTAKPHNILVNQVSERRVQRALHVVRPKHT